MNREACVSVAQEAAPEGDRTQDVRVLVVDDDERNLIAIKSILDETAEVVTASSGEEALRELLSGNFAVILLDVIMPGMDGYETATLIRGREQTRHIPIIFLSAINKDEPHLMRGYSMGAVDYVFKPVEPLVLRSKVAVFVDLFRMSREVAAKAEREKALLDENLRAHAERLEAERNLRAAEEMQAAVIESLPIALYVEEAESRGKRTLVAGSIAGLLSVKDKQEKFDWTDLIHPDDRGRVSAGLDQRCNGDLVALEYRLCGTDGRYRHVLDQSARLENGGSLVAGTLLDISDRKELEDQLLQAQKMDALGKLTGGIAHDFNNLLAAVISGIGLLERKLELPGETQKIVNMTKQAAQQGADLVGRLLAFSRTQRLEPTTIDLSQLAGEVRDLLAHTLGGRVSLGWKVPAKAWEPFADRSQLQLAVMNLVINARDAMPGGGEVSVSSRNRQLAEGNEQGLMPGEYVTITVSDEGVGMPDDILAQVMEPFFTTKETGKGTGLGLSMVYGFARQSGGTIDIRSTVGEGTSVDIWLPRSKQAAQEQPSTNDRQSTQSERLQTDARVLLVDDHDAVREATTMLLQDLGASVVAVSGGAAMLRELKAQPEAFDVILTDFAMPKTTGDEAIRRARKIVRDIPAVLVTGHANPESLVALPERTVLLNKPFTPARLLHALEKSRNMVVA